MALPSLDDYFPDWKEREALAEAMIPIIGNLYRKNVVTYCFGRALYSESVTNIMKTHRYVRQIANNELSEFESYPIMKALSRTRPRTVPHRRRQTRAEVHGAKAPATARRRWISSNSRARR